MTTAHELIQQNLTQYKAAIKRFALLDVEKEPLRVALAATLASSSVVETALLVELHRLDPDRANALAVWVHENVVEDGEVGDEWMHRWNDELAANQPLTAPATSADGVR